MTRKLYTNLVNRYFSIKNKRGWKKGGDLFDEIIGVFY